MRKTVENEAVMPEKFQGWSKLEPHEQEVIEREEDFLNEAADKYEMSEVEIGEHLTNVRTILEPKRIFNKWLLKWCRNRKRPISRATAYRCMDMYKAGKAHLTKPVLEMAAQKGIKLNPKVLAQNPPPNTTDKTKLNRYLESIRVTRIEVVKGRDTVIKEIVNFARLRLSLFPDHKTKMFIVRSVIGMILATVGVSNTQSFEPMAVPESFVAKRGRPAKAA